MPPTMVLIAACNSESAAEKACLQHKFQLQLQLQVDSFWSASVTEHNSAQMLVTPTQRPL